MAFHQSPLLTDLYQLTMSYGYWKQGKSEQQSVFHLFFRKLPFRGGFAIAAGLGPVLEFLQKFAFQPDDIEYLATLQGNDGKPLFDREFLEYLSNLKLTCDIHAMPEGTLAFANEPLLRVQGPIVQCQLLETALLNLINFPTLIATKAARICSAAGDEPVLEFGLRRAQGPDGGVTASRAAYIGGCAATSNVLAGKLYGIPVKGTHAHSWVMSFDDEMTAFEQYAEAMPNNCVFLVDTYDTLDGVRKACQVGKRLRDRGHEMVGIRLDSGDLAYLSIEARKILDEAGFPEASIVASNDLDENVIESLKHQGAKITVWGVGTKLATAYDQPALGGVYKLGALQDSSGGWIPKIKLSEQIVKTSIPGILQVKRFFRDGQMVADMIISEESTDSVPHRALARPQSERNDQEAPPTGMRIFDPADPTRTRDIEPDTTSVDLLQPVVSQGKRIADPESMDAIRVRAQQQLSQLPTSSRRLLNAHEYPVGLSHSLNQYRNAEIARARGLDD